MAGSMFFGPSALPFGDPGGSSPCWKEAGLGSSLRGIGSRTTSHSARCEVAQVAAGTVVAGRYALERCTGVGSAGSNWHAQDLESGSPCTVRLADRSSVPPSELSSLYKSEAEACARVRCDNVLDVLALGDWQQRPYLVFEHVEGEALTSHLRRRGKMDPPIAYAVISQIGRVLARAHSLGIVHGDLKPEHVLLGTDGGDLVVKVLGFGVAEVTSQASESKAALLGAAFGLPFYASPEQVLRKPLDGRSDLWSLAMITYECLTGMRPFRSHNLGDLTKLIRGDSVPALRLGGAKPPAALAAWWQRSCAREPAGRFQSAREMIDTLGRALELAPVRLPEAVFVGADRPTAPGASRSSRPPATASTPPRPASASEPSQHAADRKAKLPSEPLRAGADRKAKLPSEPPRPGADRKARQSSEPPRPAQASEPPRSGADNEAEQPSEPPRSAEASEPLRPSGVQTAAALKTTPLGIGDEVKALVGRWEAVRGPSYEVSAAAAPSGMPAGSLQKTQLGLGDQMRAAVDQLDHAREESVTVPSPEGVKQGEESARETAVDDEPTAHQSDESIRDLLEAETQRPPAGGPGTLDGMEATEAGPVDSSVPGWEQQPGEKSYDASEDEEEEEEPIDEAQLLAQRRRRLKLRVAVSAFLGGLVVLFGAAALNRMASPVPPSASSATRVSSKPAAAHPPAASKVEPPVVEISPPEPPPKVVIATDPEPEQEGDADDETVAAADLMPDPAPPAPATKSEPASPTPAVKSEPAPRHVASRSVPKPATESVPAAKPPPPEPKPKPVRPPPSETALSSSRDYGI